MALAALLYDIAITLDQEIVHFYRRKLSFVQVLWFLNRILVPVQAGAHILPLLWASRPATICPALGYIFNTWVGVFNLFIIQCSLATRTAAIYECAFGISAFIAFLVVASTASRITVLVLQPGSSKEIPAWRASGTELTLCVEPLLRKNAASFAGPLILDATLYIMTVVRLKIQGSRQPKSGVRDLFAILFRDGSIYFFVVTLAMILSISGFFYVPLFGAFATSDLYIVACSISCSRLILHLKESSRRTVCQDQDIPCDWAPQSDIEMDGTQTMKLTRSELAFGFGCEWDDDWGSSSPGVSTASGSTSPGV